MGLDGGESLVNSEELDALRDRLYLVEAALDDVEGDLRGGASLDEYRRAFQHLYAAAAQLRGSTLEPRARL